MPGWERDRVWLHDQTLEDMPEYLELSIRIRNRLTSQGIRTFGELLATPAETLLAIYGFGEKCLREVEDFIAEVTGDSGQSLARSLQNFGTKKKRPRLGFGALDDLTRACLEEIGVMDEGDLHKRTLGEILEALMYDSDSVDELWECCGIPEPLGEEELLGLLSASETARKRLDTSLYDGQKAYLDLLTGCAELVRGQVVEGFLHPQALMNFMPLQSINGRLSPPARDLSELLSVAERGAIEIHGPVLKNVEESLRTESIGGEVEELLGTLSEREVHVLRGRFAPLERTLRAVAAEIGVTGESVRQVQRNVAMRLARAYGRELPLPRLRSAMLIVSEEKAFSEERMRDVLVARGLVGEEEELDDFLAVWIALESNTVPGF